MLIGRKTYEMLNALPAEVRDEGWERPTRTSGWLFSRTLEAADWPGLKIVHDDLVDFVREQKRTDGPELRTLGSLSLVRQARRPTRRSHKAPGSRLLVNLSTSIL